jgi:uncharacterized protein (TIGR04255 family)
MLSFGQGGMFRHYDQEHGHAIREAVFSLQLAAPLGAKKIQELVAAGREAWKAELPSVEEFQGGPIIAGPGASKFAFQITQGASFQSFKRDGTLAWRLVAQDNAITVNCLEYTGWPKVWPIARDYLFGAAKVLVSEKNPIAGATLQYLNSFSWDGPAERADPRTLLRPNATPIPNAFWERSGAEWHLHQGWFEQLRETHRWTSATQRASLGTN